MAVSTSHAQDKKPEKKEPPRIVVVTPLTIAPGKPTKLHVRGLRLDTVTEIRFQDPKITLRPQIKAKNKLTLSNKQEPTRIGDTQLDLELTLPADFFENSVTFVAVSPGGESPPHRLLLERAPPIAEKEPNNGFSQAQAIQFPLELAGTIDREQDVDVFRFEGQAGQRVVIQVLASRLGSPLDGVLALFDADGRILATDDDSAGKEDPRIDVRLPHAGSWFVSLLDAHDLGGAMYTYRLFGRVIPE